MICPHCGQEMEEGLINTDGSIMSWTKGALSLRGDTLAWGPVTYLRGFRCPGCRVVVANY